MRSSAFWPEPSSSCSISEIGIAEVSGKTSASGLSRTSLVLAWRSVLAESLYAVIRPDASMARTPAATFFSTVSMYLRRLSRSRLTRISSSRLRRRSPVILLNDLTSTPSSSSAIGLIYMSRSPEAILLVPSASRCIGSVISRAMLMPNHDPMSITSKATIRRIKT